MLTPDYLESCADDIIDLYAQLDEAIIADITRRIIKTGRITESAKWQIKQAQEMGLLYDDIIAEIGRRTDASESHVRALFEDAGVKTVEFDNRIYRAAGLVPVDIRQSPAMLQVLNAGYKKTLGNMKNLTLTTANTSQNAYYNACNLAYMKITSGAFSYQEAIKEAIKQTAQQGSTVLYPSGHIDRVDVAVRRAVLTGVGQTCRTVCETNAIEMGCDLMELSAHSGARPSHAVWQGQLVSLSGRKGYLTKDDIGYETIEGFGGVNCLHDWFPYFEGISTRNYTEKALKQMNAKCFEYNGVKYSEYEISQIQRKLEREIRAAKREKVAYQTAVAESDGELKGAMQEALKYSNSLVRDKQAKMRDFINQTGEQRQYFREQNYGKVAYNGLTSNVDSGKIKEKEYGIVYGQQAILISEPYIKSKEFKKKFENATSNGKVNQTLYQCAKKMLLHRNGTLYEDMYIINAQTGYVLGKQTNSNYPQGVVYNENIKKALEYAKEYNISIIAIHNHPEGYPPSADDLNKALENNMVCGFAIGHNGQLYKYYPPSYNFSEQELNAIQNEIVINYQNGMDIDRAYQTVFEQFGLKHEIIKG